MRHLFVPYEIALRLKELGFDEPCLAFYNLDKFFFFPANAIGIDWFPKIGSKTSDIPTDQGQFAAPLYQQVIDWFREKHGIELHQACRIPREAVEAANGALDHRDFKYWFYIYREESNPRIVGNVRRNDYYEALDKAIEEALKLIP